MKKLLLFLLTAFTASAQFSGNGPLGPTNGLWFWGTNLSGLQGRGMLNTNFLYIKSEFASISNSISTHTHDLLTDGAATATVQAQFNDLTLYSADSMYQKLGGNTAIRIQTGAISFGLGNTFASEFEGTALFNQLADFQSDATFVTAPTTTNDPGTDDSLARRAWIMSAISSNGVTAVLPGAQAYTITNGSQITVGFTNKPFTVYYTNGVVEGYDTLLQAATNANGTKALVKVRPGTYAAADLTSFRDFTVEGSGWLNTIFTNDLTLGTNLTFRHLGGTNFATIVVGTAQDAYLDNVWWRANRGSDGSPVDHAHAAGALTANSSTTISGGQRLHIYHSVFQANGTVIASLNTNLTVYAGELWVGFNDNNAIENTDNADTTAYLIYLNSTKLFFKPYNFNYPRANFAAYLFSPAQFGAGTNNSSNMDTLRGVTAQGARAEMTHRIAEAGEFWYVGTNVTLAGTLTDYTPFEALSGGAINYENGYQITSGSGVTNNFSYGTYVDAGTNQVVVTNVSGTTRFTVSQKRPDMLLFALGPTTNQNPSVITNIGKVSFPYPITLHSVEGRVHNTPTTTAVLMDILTNGVSVFSGTNKILIATGGEVAATNSTFNSTTVAAGVVISSSLLQVGDSSTGLEPKESLFYYPQ